MQTKVSWTIHSEKPSVCYEYLANSLQMRTQKFFGIALLSETSKAIPTFSTTSYPSISVGKNFAVDRRLRRFRRTGFAYRFGMCDNGKLSSVFATNRPFKLRPVLCPSDLCKRSWPHRTQGFSRTVCTCGCLTSSWSGDPSPLWDQSDATNNHPGCPFRANPQLDHTVILPCWLLATPSSRL